MNKKIIIFIKIFCWYRINPYFWHYNANIMNSKLSRKHSVTAGLIARDPNWQSPVMKPPTGPGDISMAQYFNTYGTPPDGLRVMCEQGCGNWVPGEVIDTDTVKDAADPNNFGYWHNSRARVRLSDESYKWIPFSMIVVNIKAL